MERIFQSAALGILVLTLGCATAKKNEATVESKPVVESLSLPFMDEKADAQKTVKIAIIDELPPPQKVAKREELQTPKPTLKLKPSKIDIPRAKETPLIFDIPVAYNSRVKYWIQYFQSDGRGWFTKWLERSTRYMPSMQKILKSHGLPRDLAYMSMIESGFSAHARSDAEAVGPWQFIKDTGNRFGLRTSWWLDERRDFEKSTHAASRYLKKLYGMFQSWYLVAAAYNTGENRVKRMVVRHGTKNFWKLAQKNALLDETKDYVPKMIAAMLITKSPALYGFRNISYQETVEFEHFRVPGGTSLDRIADAVGVTNSFMRDLNPELVRGVVPSHVEGHLIRIPKGSYQLISRYIRRTLALK